MAATSVTLEATYGDGQTLETLADLIAKRAKFLGETTEQAVTATTILTLKSIRARTRVANPDDAAGVLVERRPDLSVSFRKEYGKNVLCIRKGGPRGVRYTGSWYSANKSNINLNSAAVYFVRDIVSKENIGTDKKTYLLIADSEQEAREWGVAKHRQRVAKYAGLAKQMLGVLMHRVSEGQGEASSQNSLINQVIGKNGFVEKTSDGFSSGSVSITVSDLLNYAMLAVEGGATTVNIALQKAANTTAARINKLAEYKLDEPIQTPFPEIAK